jgi:hypothetical protein
MAWPFFGLFKLFQGMFFSKLAYLGIECLNFVVIFAKYLSKHELLDIQNLSFKLYEPNFLYFELGNPGAYTEKKRGMTRALGCVVTQQEEK